MLLLLRYWLIPGRIRRAPKIVRLVAGLPLAIMAFLFIVHPHKALGSEYASYYFGWLNPCGFAWNWSPLLVSLFGLVAGALSIAPERQKQRWESLLLTRLSMAQILHGKLCVCLCQGLLFVLPVLVGLIHMCYLYLYTRLDSGWDMDNFRRGEIWTLFGLFVRLLSFTLVGMLISAGCKRAQTALSVCGGVIAAYVGVYEASERMYWCRADPDDEHLYGQLFYWPVMPPYGYFMYNWRVKLLADVILGVAVPILCYLLIRLLCRRPRMRKSALVAPA